MARASPRWCRSTSTTRTASSAPTARPPRSPRAAAPASRAVARLYRASASPRTAALTAEAERSASPTCSSPARYRVPFQYSRFVREHLPGGAFVQSSEGVTRHRPRRQPLLRPDRLVRRQPVRLRLLQGVHRRGRRARRGARPGARRLPPVRSRTTSRRLREISGLDEVSFHMSGTEAVMQAVRLARYHTRRTHLVRFCGAYHGWWEDVQPGVGNPLPPRETYTLKDMDEDSLRVLRTRRDIACVLVNPLQALHPNAGAPGDGSLVDSGRSGALRPRAPTPPGCERLREVCTRARHRADLRRGVRRLPARARRRAGVLRRARRHGDLRQDARRRASRSAWCAAGATLMKRFRDDRPADICFARGTFNSHPYVMAAMQEFLERLETPEIRALYDGLDERWNARAAALNARLREAERCRCRSPTCRRSGRSATRSRRATTGCSSTTCAPRAWR